MKMNIEISQDQVNQLNNVKGKLILNNSRIYIFKDFKIECRDIKVGLFKQKVKTQIFLTSCNLMSVNRDGDFVGYTNDDFFVTHMLNYFDLSKLRGSWLRFKKDYDLMIEFAEKL